MKWKPCRRNPHGFCLKKPHEMESASASLIDAEKAWPAPYAASKYKLPTLYKPPLPPGSWSVIALCNGEATGLPMYHKKANLS